MSELDAAEAEWLSPKDALVELAQKMSPHAAMAQLQEALRLGQVRGRAKLAILTSTSDRTPTPQQFDQHIVPAEWWVPDRLHMRLGGKAPRLNFDAGSFDCVASVDGAPRHVALKLVRISAADLRNYFETLPVSATPAASPTVATKNLGGVKRDSDKWDAVIIAIARFASDGRLDPGLDIRFKSQAEMRRAILEDADVMQVGISEDTIKPTVRKVYTALLGAG